MTDFKIFFNLWYLFQTLVVKFQVDIEKRFCTSADIKNRMLKLNYYSIYTSLFSSILFPSFPMALKASE